MKIGKDGTVNVGNGFWIGKCFVMNVKWLANVHYFNGTHETVAWNTNKFN